MGSYSPPPWYDEALTAATGDILRATVQAMAVEGRRYRGVIYPGLMITDDGPQVLEYNCRFGDPETQVVLPRLKSDLLEICWAVVNNSLGQVQVEWSEEACVGVVMASGGYPEEYKTGHPIAGLGSVEPDALVFHAGTAPSAGSGEAPSDLGSVVTAGGRALTVVATAATLAEARSKAYRNVQRIHFKGCHYRKDIAAPAQGARVE
jgi:phosphoribosylamine--glycine ligase